MISKKITIIRRVPFEIWAQEKVYSRIEQCVHIENKDNAKYFAMHCWNLNSLQKGLKTALRIEVVGDVDFSFTVKIKGTSSKTADKLKFYFGDSKSQYNLKIPKEDIDNDFDPIKNKEVKLEIIGEEGKAELERVLLDHDNGRMSIITAFEDDKEINIDRLRELTIPEGKIYTADLKDNLGKYINNFVQSSGEIKTNDI